MKKLVSYMVLIPKIIIKITKTIRKIIKNNKKYNKITESC